MVYKFKYNSEYGLNALMVLNRSDKILHSPTKIKLYISKKILFVNCITLLFIIAVFTLLYKALIARSLIWLLVILIVEFILLRLINKIKKVIFNSVGLNVSFEPTVYIVYENSHDKTEVEVDAEHLQKMNHYKFLPIKKYNIQIVKMPKTMWFVYMAKNYFICYTRKGELLTVLPTSDFWDFKETHKVLHLVTTAIKLPRPKSVI